MGRLSIGQKLKKASTPERKKELAEEWSSEWQKEYESHVRNLERAIRNNDYDLFCRTTGWLKADGKKRFDTLPRVLSAVAANDGETEE